MESFGDFFLPLAGFLGMDGSTWKWVGWCGNVLFFSRFLMQWFASEKRKEVVIPVSFWWMSLGGATLLLAYALHRRDEVFVFAYAFTWIPYVRNLVIHRRQKHRHVECPGCHQACPPQAHYCMACGAALPTQTGAESRSAAD